MTSLFGINNSLTGHKLFCKFYIQFPTRTWELSDLNLRSLILSSILLLLMLFSSF